MAGPKRPITPNMGLAAVIVFCFVIFQILAQRWSNSSSADDNDYFSFTHRESSISKIFNLDASLSVPFLDKVNQFWLIGGDTQIRNKEFIRLTSAAAHNKHGTVISNGVGDNTINDFEIIVKFRISNRETSYDLGNKDISEGMVFLITPENQFITQDFTNEFTRGQYEIASGGILGHDTSLMGFPKNIPGLALVVDTYQNSKRSTSGAKIPFMDAMLNLDPLTDYYDRSSDGDASMSSSLKLNKKHIQLNESVIEGDITTMRIIYMESISFLKVDIKYKSEGDYWIELFHATDDIYIPKNIETGQRYIGIGAMNGKATENVDILDVQTNEFHWDSHDESSEDSFGYVKEAQKYLAHEYGQMIAMEMDEYKRWKMIKAQPNYQTIKQNKSGFSFISLILRTIVFLILLCAAYVASVYIRISQKHSSLSIKCTLQGLDILPS